MMVSPRLGAAVSLFLAGGLVWVAPGAPASAGGARLEAAIPAAADHCVPALPGLPPPTQEALPPGIVAEPQPYDPGALRSLSAKAVTGTYEQQVVELVNQERWNNGQLAPLKHDALLGRAAEGHSAGMAQRDFFSHCDLDTGTWPSQRVAAAGYSGFANGENIAAGQTTPAAVMAAWMASSGHRANILNPANRDLGVGYYLQSGDAANVRLNLTHDCVMDSYGGPYSRYWTQNFGYSGYPVVIDREAVATTSTSVDLYMYGNGWAQQMRFRNLGGDWSGWETYNADKSWAVPSGGGLKTVFAQVKNASTVLEASDSIVLDAACGAPTDLEVFNDTVNTPPVPEDVREACDTITSWNFEIEGSSHVVFHAGSRVVLDSGFSVGTGARFTALIDPHM